MRQYLAVLTLAFVSMVAAAQPLPPSRASRGSARMEFAGQSVDTMIASFMDEQGVRGMSLAIVQAPYITRATGYGLGDAARRTLVAGNTIFDIARIRDAFTAVAVMQLVEEQKVGLDEVRALLRDPAQYAQLEKLVARASGGTYADYVTRRQIEPLGLRHTFFGGDLGKVKRETHGAGERHRRFLQERTLIDPTEPATGYRGGSAVAVDPNAIYSSSADLSFWDIALAGDVLIRRPELRKLVYTAPIREDGSKAFTSGAWYFPGHEGLMVSGGSANGFSSLLARFTRADELVCVTLLANKEGVDLTQLARRIAGAHNFKLGPPERAEGMRVQQTPYDPATSLARLGDALRAQQVEVAPSDDGGLIVDNTLDAAVWTDEGGDVWLMVADPPDPALRNTLDQALLRAVAP